VTFSLRRTSGQDLSLTEQHELIALPRKGEIRWNEFDRARYSEADLENAISLWRARAFTEMHSLALFTQVASQVHLLGAPLDWAGAFARMTADEVRHTDLCLKMCQALGGVPEVKIDADKLHLRVRGESLRAHVRTTILAAFCISETLSKRMFMRSFRAATVPLARDVVGAILVDETFHAELGWELGALLMREADDGFEKERADLVDDLPDIIAQTARMCCVTRGPIWTREQPEIDEGENFAALCDAGYARAFFDGMEEDVIPGLEAIGLPEARPIWEAYVAKMDAMR